MRSLIIAAAALCLGACATTGGQTGYPINDPSGTHPSSTGSATVGSPADIAAKTIVDEKLAIGAEESYKTFRLAVELGVQAGVVHGQLATKMRETDSQLFSALGLIRNAYSIGNATDFQSAVSAFNAALINGNQLLAANTGHGGH